MERHTVRRRKGESDETDPYLFLPSHKSAISHHTRLCKDIVFIPQPTRDEGWVHGRRWNMGSNDGAHLPHKYVQRGRRDGSSIDFAIHSRHLYLFICTASEVGTSVGVSLHQIQCSVRSVVARLLTLSYSHYYYRIIPWRVWGAGPT